MTWSPVFRHGLVIAVIILTAGLGVGAQSVAVSRYGVARASDRFDPVVLSLPRGRADSARRAIDRLPLWAAPIASAVVPGLGQMRLHHDRFVGYMATEAYLILQHLKSIRERDSNADAYKEIARSSARRTFVLTPGSTPPDSVWRYYESMRNYLESGFFTLSPTGAIVPETDTSTFNGHQWLVARLQYGIGLNDPGASSSPTYPNALAYYESNAVKQQFRWSWRNAQLEWDVYKRTTEMANDAQRQATNDLIALIANHILSSIDAFASVRLLQAAGGVRISASVPLP